MRVKLALPLVALLLLPMIASAQKTPDDWQSVTLPSNNGFVMSMKIPPGWKYEAYARRDVPRFETRAERRKWRSQKVPVWLTGPEKTGVHVIMRAYNTPRSLATYLETFKSWHKAHKGTLARQADDSFGRPSWSHLTTHDKNSRRPTAKRAFTMYHDRVLIEASTRKFPEKFPEAVKTFDRILRSITVSPVGELDTAPANGYYASPAVRVTPGRWELDAEVSALVPSGWTVEVIEAAHGRGNHRSGQPGRLELEFRPSGGPENTGITVGLIGYAYGNRPGREQFFKTRAAVMDFLADDVREVPGPENAEIPKGTIRPSVPMQFGFCLSQARSRRFTASGRIETKTFTGKDPISGEGVKFRVYTAGGYTLACNVIIRAPMDKFDAFLPAAKQFVRSLSVIAEGTIMLK